MKEAVWLGDVQRRIRRRRSLWEKVFWVVVVLGVFLSTVAPLLHWIRGLTPVLGVVVGCTLVFCFIHYQINRLNHRSLYWEGVQKRLVAGLRQKEERAKAPAVFTDALFAWWVGHPEVALRLGELLAQRAGGTLTNLDAQELTALTFRSLARASKGRPSARH